MFSHRRRAGNGKERNSFVSKVIITHYRRFGNDKVKDTLGNIISLQYVMNDVHGSNGCQRRFRGGFPNYYITGNSSKCCIPCPNGYRKIVGGNQSHNAQWMILLGKAVVYAFRLQVYTVNQTGLTHCKVTDVNHLLYFAKSFLINFTHFVSYQSTQLFFVFAQGQSNLSNNFASDRSGHFSPRFKSCFRFLHNSFIIVHGGIFYFGNLFPVNRGNGRGNNSLCIFPFRTGCNPKVHCFYP